MTVNPIFWYLFTSFTETQSRQASQRGATTERPTVPGQFYYAYHVEIPTPAKIYYTVFSLTRDASGAIVRDSFVECTAVGYIIIKCEIATEETSWGAIKSLYR